MTNSSLENGTKQTPEIGCDGCESFKPLVYPTSHFAHYSYGTAKGILCNECADTDEKREIPLGLMRQIIENTQLDKPLSGSFRPIEVSPDDPSSGAYEYWMEIGHMVLEEMAVWKDKILKFSFGGTRYKGLWLKPQWDGNSVVGISLAGDTPSKKLELDVYQSLRLTQMGFQEEGKTNKTWSIQLTEPEGTIPNASAIIIHILRFGYLLEPSDLNSITPTLDVDFSDPEFRKP